MSEKFIVTEDYFYQLGDCNLSLKEGTSKDSVFTNKQKLSRQNTFCIYIYIYTGRNSIYNQQVEDFPYLKPLKENGAALKIDLQVKIAESAFSRLNNFIKKDIT